MRAIRIFPVVAVLLALAASVAIGFAQEEVKQRLEQAKAALDRIEQSLQRQDIDQSSLQELRNELDPLIDRLRELVGELEPATKEVEDRLRELGPRPEQGRTEDLAITQQREETQRRFATVDADLRQARLLSVRAGQISERLADKRRELLTRQLFERSASILDPNLWRDAAASLPRYAMGFGFFFDDWLRAVGNSGSLFGFVLLALTLALAVVLYWPVRRRLLAAPFGSRFSFAATETPTAMQRTVIAAWMAIVNALLPAIAAFLVVRVMQSLQLVPFRFGDVANALVLAVIIFSSLRAVAVALLAPDRPAWRFLPASDAIARRTVRTATWIGAVVALFLVLQTINAAIIAPLPATVALLGIRCIVFSVVLALGLTASARIEAHEREERAKDPYSGPTTTGGWRWLRPVLWLVAIVVGASPFLGYSAFGAYLSGQTVWVLIVLGALKMLLALVDETLSEGTRAGTATSRRISDMVGAEPTSVEQAGIVVSGIVRVVLLTIAAFMIIVPWGVESRDALGVVRALFFGVQIGGINISLAVFLLAMVVFSIALIATRGVQRWLDNRLLPSTRMDIGLRNSVRTVFGYLGFLVAVVLGLSFLGLDLQNLAIVAGALSVGIGFGLQSMVSNFVSGLILLAERPIKEGDWIVVGDAEGYVKRINVRSTEIETFDKAVVIVPNSNLVSGTVKNWMHNDLFGRTKINLGVPQTAEPERVRALLVEIAKKHPLVTSDPEPRAYLVDFNENALLFELTFTVTNVDKSFVVRSDLRFEIVRRFRDEGLNIK